MLTSDLAWRIAANIAKPPETTRRPHLSNALATGPKHLPLLSQVLSGKTPQSHELSEKKGAVRVSMDQRIRSCLADALALAAV
jgi:hypothetical protein